MIYLQDFTFGIENGFVSVLWCLCFAERIWLDYWGIEGKVDDLVNWFQTISTLRWQFKLLNVWILESWVFEFSILKKFELLNFKIFESLNIRRLSQEDVQNLRVGGVVKYFGKTIYWTDKTIQISEHAGPFWPLRKPKAFSVL